MFSHCKVKKIAWKQGGIDLKVHKVAVIETAGPMAKHLDLTEFDISCLEFCEFHYCDVPSLPI